MILSQTKIYRTKAKSEPIFFLPEEEKKLILVLRKEECENEVYVENLRKTTQVLGINFNEEVFIQGVSNDHQFNWDGILSLKKPLTICFFGPDLSGFEVHSINTINKLGEHIIFQTFTMGEIVKEQSKKGEFWASFKSLFGK